MALKILNANNYTPKHSDVELPHPLLVWINKNGQLEFSLDAEKQLGLKNIAAIKFAQSDEHSQDLYLILCKEQEEGAFRIINFLDTYYVLAKPLFDRLGYQYEYSKISFELTREDDLDGHEVYRMQKV